MISALIRAYTRAEQEENRNSDGLWEIAPWDDTAATAEVRAERWEQERRWQEEGLAGPDRVRRWMEFLGIAKKQDAKRESEPEDSKEELRRRLEQAALQHSLQDNDQQASGDGPVSDSAAGQAAETGSGQGMAPEEHEKDAYPAEAVRTQAHSERQPPHLRRLHGERGRRHDDHAGHDHLHDHHHDETNQAHAAQDTAVQEAPSAEPAAAEPENTPEQAPTEGKSGQSDAASPTMSIPVDFDISAWLAGVHAHLPQELHEHVPVWYDPMVL